MRLSFCNKRICMYAFGPCGARPALHCMHCLQGRWFRPWSKLRNSSQSQLAFSVKLTAINSCRSTKTVTAFKRALKTELIAVAYGSHLGLAFLFTRLRFARDLRRFRNVFWLIDWLTDWFVMSLRLQCKYNCVSSANGCIVTQCSLATDAVFGRLLKHFSFQSTVLVYTVHQRHLRRCAI